MRIFPSWLHKRIYLTILWTIKLVIPIQMLDKAGFLNWKDHAFLMNNSRQANKLGSNPDFTSSLHSCDALHASNLLIQKQNNSIMENLIIYKLQVEDQQTKETQR